MICECSDPGCQVHEGKEECNHRAVTVVVRIDMEDQFGTPMCRKCANDALDSGVFDERASYLRFYKEGVKLT